MSDETNWEELEKKTAEELCRIYCDLNLFGSGTMTQTARITILGILRKRDEPKY